MLVQEQVLGLDVPVDDAHTLVEVVDTRDEVPEVLPQVVGLKGLGLAYLLGQGTVLQVLHNDVQFVHLGVVQYLVQFNYVLMVL